MTPYKKEVIIGYVLDQFMPMHWPATMAYTAYVGV